MRHETAQIHLRANADKPALEAELLQRARALPGVRSVALGRNLEGCRGAGAYTLDLQCAPDASPTASRASTLAQLQGVAHVDLLEYRRFDGGLREAALRVGVWRTLMLRVRPQASEQQIAGLERELLQMPVYMPSIRNWQLARVVSPSGWTHVWQQEFASTNDLLGEYLMHPFHWGWVDRWFDPEHPDWTVEAISHAFCPQPSSLLADCTANSGVAA